MAKFLQKRLCVNALWIETCLYIIFKWKKYNALYTIDKSTRKQDYNRKNRITNIVHITQQLGGYKIEIYLK